MRHQTGGKISKKKNSNWLKFNFTISINNIKKLNKSIFMYFQLHPDLYPNLIISEEKRG